MSSGSQQSIEKETREKYAAELAQIKEKHHHAQSQISDDMAKMIEDLETSDVAHGEVTNLPVGFERIRFKVTFYAIKLQLVNEFDQILLSGNFGRSDASFYANAK